MLVILEIVTDHGWCHMPDLEYLALAGTVEEIDEELLEIVRSLRDSQRISQLKIGGRVARVWGNTALCML